MSPTVVPMAIKLEETLHTANEDITIKSFAGKNTFHNYQTTRESKTANKTGNTNFK